MARTRTPPSTAQAVRRRIAGDEHIRDADAGLDPVLTPMRDAMTEWAWGQVWSRPALSIERRILMNLGLLIALNRPNELRMAIRIALRHGLSAVEIGEAILHTAVYCGVPAAAGALCIASEVFAENLAPPSARPGPAHDSTTDDARSIESRPTKLRRSAPPMHKK